MLYDAESSDKWELTLDKLKHGLQAWLCENSAVIYSGEIDTADIDCDCANEIIQYALFGKFVFG